MKTPIVEMDGDEMTRVIWQMIKDELIAPYIDLKTEYYDLSVTNRDNTDNQVTVDAAHAIQKYHVGVKCATITANPQRVEEYHLKQMLPSPNAVIRGILDGTIFRAPICLEHVNPVIPGWKKPITVARHSFGDIFNGQEFHVDEAGATARLVVEDKDGKEICNKKINTFDGAGVVQGVFNKEDSIRNFAETCFQFAVDTKQDLWFCAKDTICKTYDVTFRNIFEETYNKFKAQFDELGITYFYTLIDDAIARTIRGNGGYIWALKNADGDVMSDMVSSGFGSLALMTSVLVTPDGNWEYEAAHGTIPRHYYKYLKGEATSTNPMATIFAWTGALRKNGELDNIPELGKYADALEKACIDTINAGTVTKDIVPMLHDVEANPVTTEGFFAALKAKLDEYMA